MENRSSSLMVEITVLSAENLRVKGRSVKKNAFAIVKADAFNSHFTKKDAVRGSNPLWDEKFVMHMPMHTRSIDLEVKYKTSSGGDRLVGTASLPVSDFISEYLPENHVRLLSYVLRNKKEKKSGIINLSVKVKLPEDTSSSLNVEAVAIGVPVDI